MNGPVDHADELRDLLDEEGGRKIAKNIAFEQSSLGYILRQIGYTARQVKGLQRDLGEGFGFDWFNTEGLIYAHVESVRIFDFNFEDILFKAENHPISRHMKTVFSSGEISPDDAFCLVFKAYGLGRMVATTLDVDDYTHIHVKLSDYSYSITPFTGFFKSKFGNITD